MSYVTEHPDYSRLRSTRPDLFGERAADCYPLLPGGSIRAANEHLLLLDDRVMSPSGHEVSYLRIVAPPSGAPGAAMLPIIDGDVLLLDHPRHAPGRRLLEIPRGFGDESEPAEQCARRELMEELGVAPLRLDDLGMLLPDSGLLATEVALFAAQMPDAGWSAEAGVRIRRLGVVAAEDAIRDGEIVDGFTIAAFFRARLRGMI